MKRTGEKAERKEKIGEKEELRGDLLRDNQLPVI